MSALLEAASLSKTFFSEHNALPAVCNVGFSVAPGECLGLAGASGCVSLRASLRAAGAAKLLLRTKTQTTLSLNKL